MRKPSRIPFFTQAFTRHPVFVDASGSAARISTRVQRLFEALEKIGNVRRCKLRVFRRIASRSQPACTLRPASRPKRFEHLFDLRQIGCGFGGHNRQPPHRLQQSHQRHRRLHRNRIRFHEVHFHQRQIFALQLARAREIVGQRALGELRQLAPEFRWRPRRPRRGRPERSTECVMESSPHKNGKAATAPDEPLAPSG